MRSLRSLSSLFSGPSVIVADDRETAVETKAYGSSDPDLLSVFGIAPTVAGPSVSPTSAMTVPAVANAVQLIATAIGSLPVKLYERTDDGNKAENRDHPAYKIAHDEASEELSAEEFRTALTVDALLHGAGYAFIVRDLAGQAIELLRLDPTRVTAKTDTRNATYFEFAADTGRRVFAFNQVMRVIIPGGTSPLKFGRETIALSIALEQAAARIFNRAGRPSGAITVPSALGDEGLRRMKTGWQAAHGGDKSGGTAILEHGATYNQLTFATIDGEFASMRRHQVLDTARLFNLPATMLQALENGTLNNVEQQSLGFRTFTLGPWLSAWSRAYGRALLSPSERDHLFFEFVVDGLNAADTAARTDQLQKLISSRVMTPNEARSVMNMPAHPQGNDLVNPYTSTSSSSPSPAQGPAK